MNKLVSGVGIQNGSVVFSSDGVSFTSDIYGRDGEVLILQGANYSNIGGAPWKQYHEGLSQIHFEQFDSTSNYGMNISASYSGGLAFSGGYFATESMDFRATSNAPGVDTIYIDTTGKIFGADINSKTFVTIAVHEMLHESQIIDAKVSDMLAQIQGDYDIVLSSDRLRACLS